MPEESSGEKPDKIESSAPAGRSRRKPRRPNASSDKARKNETFKGLVAGMEEYVFDATPDKRPEPYLLVYD